MPGAGRPKTQWDMSRWVRSPIAPLALAFCRGNRGGAEGGEISLGGGGVGKEDASEV